MTISLPKPAAPVAPRLIALLEHLIAAHDELLELTAEHADALRRAEGHAIDDCVRRRAGLLARLGELNDQRAALLRAYPRGATLAHVAATLQPHDADRVRSLGQTLRQRVLDARAQQSRIRHATERLLAHMRGMVAQVQRSLGNAATYSGTGRIAITPRAAPAALDLTS